MMTMMAMTSCDLLLDYFFECKGELVVGLRNVSIVIFTVKLHLYYTITYNL